MKKILAAITLLTAASAANAQDWGIRAAFDINVPSKLGGTQSGEKVDWYDNGFGASLGVVYDQWLSSSVFLEPGISLFYDTYSYKDLIIMDDSYNRTIRDPKVYKAGVRIPVVIGYSYDIFNNLPVRVYTGPELSYAFAGDIRIKHRGTELADLHLFGKNGEQNRVNASWKIGVGADIDFVTLDVEVAIGMTDIYRGPLTCRENRVSIALTRFF